MVYIRKYFIHYQSFRDRLWLYEISSPFVSQLWLIYVPLGELVRSCEEKQFT